MFKKWLCNHEYELLGEIVEKNRVLNYSNTVSVAYCPRCDKEIRGTKADIELLLLKQKVKSDYEGGR